MRAQGCLFCLHPHCLRATAYFKLKFLCVCVFFPFPKLQKTREARHVSVCGANPCVEGTLPVPVCWVYLESLQLQPHRLKLALAPKLLVQPATGSLPSPGPPWPD